MSELTLHGRDVHTVFDLLGDKENDITYSVGWALGQSDRLVRALLDEVFPGENPGELLAVRLQEFLAGGGYTDIEVHTERLRLILEAKRGWNLPTLGQLRQYAPRLDGSPERAIVVTSECSPEYAQHHLGVSEVQGVPVKYVSWKRVFELVEQTAGSGPHAERRLLRDLGRYLKGLMTMQNVTSNMVYVVSLGTGELFGSGLSFADIVVKHDRYFHPMGGGRGGWPKSPPNYVGFRFHGKLQQVRHVDDYDIRPRPWDEIPALKGKTDWGDKPHFEYKLGPVITPAHDVRTGKLYRAQRVWAALDLLLTSQTVSEARDLTNARLDAVGEG